MKSIGRAFSKGFWFACWLAVAPGLLQARAVRVYSAAELDQCSDIICIGTPTEIATSRTKNPSHWGPGAPDFANQRASVKLLKAWKGDVPATFDVVYEVEQPLTESPNSPIRPRLMKGAVYLFYLKRTPAGLRFSLEDTYDNIQTVQMLAPPGKLSVRADGSYELGVRVPDQNSPLQANWMWAMDVAKVEKITPAVPAKGAMKSGKFELKIVRSISALSEDYSDSLTLPYRDQKGSSPGTTGSPELVWPDPEKLQGKFLLIVLAPFGIDPVTLDLQPGPILMMVKEVSGPDDPMVEEYLKPVLVSP